MGEFTPVDQLRAIIDRWPRDPVDITGVLLDYLGRTGTRIDRVLRMNNEIYDEIFIHGSQERAKEFLRAAIRSDVEAVEIREACAQIFPVLSKLIASISEETRSASRTVETQFFDNPEEYLGHSVDFVFWQISDIHFGKYNTLDNDPRELASLLAKAAFDHKVIAPKLVVVSGDVSSIAADAEFLSFVQFCRHLKEFFSPLGALPILAIPGNHDAQWLGDGTADRMEKFRSGVAEAGCCITPFGPPVEDQAGSQLRVVRHNPSPETVPPFATVSVSGGPEFVLLVSGYFSGNVPEDVRKAVEADPSKDRLHELLRLDQGAVNREYLLNLSSALAPAKDVRLGVMHHNPIQYGIETCANRFAPQLLETLFNRGVHVVLHGHTHLSEDHSTRRPVSPGSAYPIPCPTLTSITSAGERGMNVFMLGQDGADTRMSVLVWSMSSSTQFKKEGLRLRYTLKLASGRDVEVMHGHSRPSRGS